MPTAWLLSSLFLIALVHPLKVAAQLQQAHSIPFYLPIESDELEQPVSQLAAALSTEGLNHITPVAVKYWNSYQQSIRHGKRGIYLAAPHYSAWAVVKHNFVPVLRIAEPLKYVIAARRGDSHLFEINDLHNRLVCAQNPLNLDYLLINRAFHNPLSSAEINTVQSVGSEMSSKSSQCEGFAISDHRFKKLATAQPQQFIRLYQGNTTNNYSFIASPDIEEQTINQLRSLLLSETFQSLLKPLLTQFAGNPALIAAKYGDYKKGDFQALLPYWSY